MSKILTTAAVERIKPDPVRRLEIPDAGLPGVYLVVQPSGAKSWAVRYRAAGKPKKLTLGAFPAIDLKAARDLGRAALISIAAGADPAGEKAARRRLPPVDVSRDTVRATVERFVERYAKTNTRESSARETQRLLNVDVVPAWGDRPVQEITRRDVIELLDGIVDRGAPIAANRTLAAVRRMFGWLVERGVVTSNPCDGVKAPSPEKSRDRVLSDDELKLVWQASDALGQPFGPMIRVLLLTGQRLREVGEMSDREIDLTNRNWTIPKERSKNGAAHSVPLSDLTLETISSVRRIRSERGYIFTTTGRTAASGYSKAKERLDAEMLRLARKAAAAATEDPEAVSIPHWTLHDLRRTMASGMARLGINLPVIERILNHTSGSFGGIVGVYQRHSFADEKRAALEIWSRFVENLTSEASETNVVSLQARAS